MSDIEVGGLLQSLRAEIAAASVAAGVEIEFELDQRVPGAWWRRLGDDGQTHRHVRVIPLIGDPNFPAASPDKLLFATLFSEHAASVPGSDGRSLGWREYVISFLTTYLIEWRPVGEETNAYRKQHDH